MLRAAPAGQRPSPQTFLKAPSRDVLAEGVLALAHVFGTYLRTLWWHHLLLRKPQGYKSQGNVQ